jgi:hypothetical protein
MMIVRRDGTVVRIYSRNANDWTARLRGIADGAQRIKAKSFTIDGEAVVLGPDGLSRFEELSRQDAADSAILYAFDLIEHDGEDLRNRPFLDRKTALPREGEAPQAPPADQRTPYQQALEAATVGTSRLGPRERRGCHNLFPHHSAIRRRSAEQFGEFVEFFG